jgi:uncharacterized protein YlaI
VKIEQCTNCGSTENIEVHHIDSNRWRNNIENLAPFCHECHMKIHNGHEDLSEWTEKLDPEPYLGAPTPEEVDDALADAGLL